MDFGDFASNQDEEEDIEEVAEPWSNYHSENNPLVFCLIRLGEVLNERYLIERKLGHGGFSTVWMAHDLQERTDVALKVMSLGGYDENETRIQAEIKQNEEDKSHLVVYLDKFLLPRGGKNDIYHGVLVLPLMGPCISWHILTKNSMTYRMYAAQQLL
ncbi:kinase domain-containing protein [Penicillium malachiteum]|nr:kinase domain-containing protein [Penicillium malachiteum]